MNEELTEAAVHAWLVSEKAKLDASGVESLELSVSSAPLDCRVCAAGYGSGTYTYSTGHGPTIAEAMAELRKKVPAGLERIAQLRAEAAKLLAQAEKLEGGL